jgi:hypothetical protein
MPRAKGPFEGYAKNREPMLEVIRKHRARRTHRSPTGCRAA